MFAHVKATPENVCKLYQIHTTSFFPMVNHVGSYHSQLQRFNCENSIIKNYHCKDCNFETELTVLFKHHVGKRHSVKGNYEEKLSRREYNIQKYVCEKCGYQTFFSLAWLQHELLCLQDKENTKNKTCIKDMTKDALTAYKCDERDKYQCSLKKQKVMKYLNEKDHNLKEPYYIKWYKCAVCSHKTKRNWLLKTHINARHLDEKYIKWYDCKECSYKTKRRWNLKNHISTRHLDEKDIKWFRCKKCPYKTKHSSDLKSHINAYHLDEDNIKWYECKECSYKGKRNWDLKKHINAHHLEEKDIEWHGCKKCSYKTKRKSDLKRHINALHLYERDIK